jgi:predicted DNA-binding protein (MmcQ/YjbR family)
LRAICLALPEAVEKETWDIPTFRIRAKIFAMVHDRNGRIDVWCKAPPGAQAVLVAAAPDRFFRPSYVGHKGWIGFWLDGEPDWEEVADLLGRSYRMTAPKRLVQAVSSSTGEKSRLVQAAASGSPVFDWHSGPIDRQTPITQSYRHTQNVRRFFTAACGRAFRFNRPFMAWLTDGTPKTMGDAIDEWLRRERARSNASP